LHTLRLVLNPITRRRILKNGIEGTAEVLRDDPSKVAIDWGRLKQRPRAEAQDRGDRRARAGAGPDAQPGANDPEMLQRILQVVQDHAAGKG
jgi:hypothetical protein